MTGDTVQPRPGSVAELDHFWERSKLGWHAVYLGLLAITAVSTVGNEDLSTGRRVLLVVLLGVMASSYLLVGKRLLGNEGGATEIAYLTVTWGCFYGVLVTGGSGFDVPYVLLFALFPQIWASIRTRWAVGATVVAISGLTVVEIGRRGWTTKSIPSVLEPWPHNLRWPCCSGSSSRA
ncbi:MAG: hypothetical protein ICV70_06700 [Jiangellaceae bacterium]|nr:hypothetical protein [Jiangellaceae bacterium]